MIVGYPLWFQFAGPQSYSGLDFDPFGNDTVAFTRTATQSLSGVPSAIAEVSLNEMEENAAFGWSLIALMLDVTVWLWRDRLARALALGMYAMALQIRGQHPRRRPRRHGHPPALALLDELPLFDTVLMSRFAMGCLPAIGALLALATARVLALPPSIRSRRPGPPDLGRSPPGGPAADRAARPAGRQSRHGAGVHRAGHVAPVRGAGRHPRLGAPGITRRDRTTALAGARRPGVQPGAGCFVGPKSTRDPAGRYGAALRPTTAILEDVRRTGITRPFTPAQREQARQDLRYWNADVLVLAPGRNDMALGQTVDDLLGIPSRVVGGVWLWDLRALS